MYLMSQIADVLSEQRNRRPHANGGYTSSTEVPGAEPLAVPWSVPPVFPSRRDPSRDDRLGIVAP